VGTSRRSRRSQSDLADKTGVSRQTVNAVERERYELSLSLAFAIAAVFGRRIEEIPTPAAQTARE